MEPKNQINQTTNEQAEPVTTKTRVDTRPHQIFIGAIFIMAVVVGLIYYVMINYPDPRVPKVEQISPETVLATVNGEDIQQLTINQRLSEASQALAAQGADLNNPSIRAQVEVQLLEDTINYILLKQGSLAAGITPDTQKIEETFQTFVVQAGGQQQLETQLQQAGLTEGQFKERLAEQLRIDTYISENVSITDIVITEEEITSFYNSAVASMGEGAPPLGEVRDQIVQQLNTQRQQELITSFTNQLRQTADIELK